MGLWVMGQAIAPRSLRSFAAINSGDERAEYLSGKTVTAVAGLIAVASVTGAEAQQTSLPPVNVDAPVARPRPATSKPTPDQVRARDALRRAARRNQPTQAPVPFPNAGQLSADRNPYADAAAPYKVDHLQASGKFPEPLLNTPKSVTVLSKEVLEDKNATTLRQAILSTAGVTLGTGEGGNAFGDRFFIRGFDARNDVFIDGVRDSGVSVRENFFTEQVEILRGPASSFAGRGTAGGAINIVTLFLAEPDEYDGGELVIEDTYGSHEVKLPAGDLVLYPASSLHLVTSVTRGARTASFFWLQSMIRDTHARSLIYDLDTAIQALAERLGRDDSETVKLTGIYHNLIRQWAEV